MVGQTSTPHDIVPRPHADARHTRRNDERLLRPKLSTYQRANPNSRRSSPWDIQKPALVLRDTAFSSCTGRPAQPGGATQRILGCGLANHKGTRRRAQINTGDISTQGQKFWRSNSAAGANGRGKTRERHARTLRTRCGCGARSAHPENARPAGSGGEGPFDLINSRGCARTTCANFRSRRELVWAPVSGCGLLEGQVVCVAACFARQRGPGRLGDPAAGGAARCREAWVWC